MATIPAPVDEATTWKRCSTCRGAIAFGALYYVCSVSTCNRARLTYRFCSVECWEEHLPLMRHREAWAVEETAPTKSAWAAQEGGASPVRPTVEVSKREESTARPSAPAAPAPPAAPAAKPAAAVPSAAAPAVAAPAVAAVTADAPRRRIRVGSAPRPAAAGPAAPAAAAAAAGSDDVLVVVSRFKAYVRERFGMNTSDSVMETLSDHLRAICHRAAENARSDGRKTVMDRDFEFLKRRG
jgi:hypothetical protein